MLANPGFIDALPGFLLPDSASQLRIGLYSRGCKIWRRLDCGFEVKAALSTHENHKTAVQVFLRVSIWSGIWCQRVSEPTSVMDLRVVARPSVAANRVGEITGATPVFSGGFPPQTYSSLLSSLWGARPVRGRTPS